jgi:2-polyprenyl-3-methyl-5-hydroxy-6-metoxy-1,4-benzoquinol methylase
MDNYLINKIDNDKLLSLGVENLLDAQKISPDGNPYLLLTPQTPLNKGNFDYITHYTQDHKTFNYLEASPCAAQVDDERRVHQRILNAIPKTALDILDVGCGGGWLARAMQHKPVNITSMDLSAINVEKVIDNIPSNRHHGIVADSIQHPFADRSFDCIVASEVIEHVPDPEAFLASLATALTDRGIIIITTPYKEHIIHETCINCNHPTPRNAHLHSFDETILQSIAPPKMSSDTVIFGNKALMKLRTYKILHRIGLPLYSKIDQLANFILNKPAHIMMIYRNK